MRNPELDGRAAGVWGGHDDGTYELVSAGSDGRVLVWDASDVSHPVYGYELMAVNEASGAMTTWGASCAEFSRGSLAAGRVTTTHVEPGSFYAGSDGGPVFRCAARHSRTTKRSLGTDSKTRASLPRCIRPSNRRTTATSRRDARGVREPSRPEGLRDVRRRRRPARVHALRPFRRVVTATSARALFAAGWSPTRPALIACGGVGGRVCLYDLTATGGEDVQPTEQFRACDAGTDVQAIAFNPALPEYLATADARFVCGVWELGAGLTTERAGERRVIDAIAGAETSAEAAAALDAAKASRR